MDGLCPDAQGRGDHCIDVEIAVGGGARAYVDCLVSEADVEGVTVGVRVDSDGRDAHVPASAHDAYGDLAAVGY